MFGKKSKLILEQQSTIEQLQSRLSELEKENQGLKQKLDSYVQRELAIVNTLTEASLHAQRIREQAQQEGDLLKEEARKELYLSKKRGEDVVEEAHRSARDIVKDAEKQREESFQQADQALSDYAMLLSDFNDVLRQQAKEARESAQRYEAYCAKLAGDFPLLLQKLPKLTDASAMEALPKVSELVGEDLGSVSTEDILDLPLSCSDNTLSDGSAL